MEEMSFKIVKLVGARQEYDEIVLQSGNFLILLGRACRFLFEIAVNRGAFAFGRGDCVATPESMRNLCT
jgi:hypothetical protein